MYDKYFILKEVLLFGCIFGYTFYEPVLHEWGVAMHS